jgi:hypothetical protein
LLRRERVGTAAFQQALCAGGISAAKDCQLGTSATLILLNFGSKSTRNRRFSSINLCFSGVLVY